MTDMTKKKQILLICDMPGYGKVATAVMIPILSYMGHPTYNIPTMLISNTFEYGRFEMLETTDYISGTFRAWHDLGFTFDAVATGYIPSERQAQIVSDFCKEQAAQGNPSPFASGQGLHRSLGRRTVQGIHSPFELRIQLPSIAVVYLLGKLALPFYESGHLLVVHRLAELQIHLLILLQQVNRLLHALLNHFQYGLVLIHLRLLLKVAHTIAGAPYHFAAVGLVQACDDLHKRGLSGAVQTYDADLGPVKE